MATVPVGAMESVQSDNSMSDMSDHEGTSPEMAVGPVKRCNGLVTDSLEGTDSEKKKKTRGRVKIGIKLIDHKQKRSATFHKRKGGLMKKGFELSVLTGAEVLVLAAWGDSVFSYSTKKLQRVLTSQSGQELIHHCLRTPAEDVSNEEVAMRWSPEGNYVVRELSLPKNEKRRRAIAGPEADDGMAKRDYIQTHPHTMPVSQQNIQVRQDKSTEADDGMAKRGYVHSHNHTMPLSQQSLQARQDKLAQNMAGLQRDEVSGLPVMMTPVHGYPQQHLNNTAANGYIKQHMANRIQSYADYQAPLTNRLVYLPPQQVGGGGKPMPGQPAMLPQIAQVTAHGGDMGGLQAPLMSVANTNGQQTRQDSELFGMMPAMML